LIQLAIFLKFGINSDSLPVHIMNQKRRGNNSESRRLSWNFSGLFMFVVVALLAPLPSRAANPRDFGADVSHYQGATGISQSSWNQMYTSGLRFTFIKATEGLTGPDDAAMTNNVTRATAAGILAGVYHYPHAENRPTTNGAVQEASHFLLYAGDAIGPGRLRPALDVEGSNLNLSVSALTDWIIAFCNEVVAQRGEGARPIIYMGRASAKNEVDSRLANYDFWLAYPTNVDASTSDPPPTASYPDPTGIFNNWAFWQYIWTGDFGGINPLDLDVCHSEYKALPAYIIPTPSPVFLLQNLSLGPGGFHFTFTNVAGTHFTVLGSTSISIPLSNWSILGAAVEGPPGKFQFTDTNATTGVRDFYRVRSP
jgi:GH25 family lysozyme M1 (1,4-beta-N-acetylmuramidase)